MPHSSASSSSSSSSPTSHTHSSSQTTSHLHKKTPFHLSGFQHFLNPQQQQYATMAPLSPDQHLNMMTPTSRIVFDRDELEQGAESAGFTEGQNATRGLLGSSLKPPKHPRYHEERRERRAGEEGRDETVKKSMKKMKSFFGLRKAGKYGS